jgi:hypothetical protein
LGEKFACEPSARGLDLPPKRTRPVNQFDRQEESAGGFRAVQGPKLVRMGFPGALSAKPFAKTRVVANPLTVGHFTKKRRRASFGVLR